MVHNTYQVLRFWSTQSHLKKKKSNVCDSSDVSFVLKLMQLKKKKRSHGSCTFIGSLIRWKQYMYVTPCNTSFWHMNAFFFLAQCSCTSRLKVYGYPKKVTVKKYENNSMNTLWYMKFINDKKSICFHSYFLVIKGWNWCRACVKMV